MVILNYLDYDELSYFQEGNANFCLYYLFFYSSVKGHLTLQTHGPGFPGGSVVKYPPAVREMQETRV